MTGPCFFMKRPPSVRKCCLKERGMECQILQYTALPLRVGGKIRPRWALPVSAGQDVQSSGICGLTSSGWAGYTNICVILRYSLRGGNPPMMGLTRSGGRIPNICVIRLCRSGWGEKSVRNGSYLFRLGRMFNYPVFAALLHPGGLDNQ